MKYTEDILTIIPHRMYRRWLGKHPVSYKNTDRIYRNHHSTWYIHEKARPSFHRDCIQETARQLLLLEYTVYTYFPNRYTGVAKSCHPSIIECHLAVNSCRIYFILGSATKLSSKIECTRDQNAVIPYIICRRQFDCHPLMGIIQFIDTSI
jgi:hypothetical protein